MLAALRENFPTCWFRPGEEFAPEYAGQIWSGEGSTIKDPVGNYWDAFESGDPLYNQSGGVHPDIYKLLRERGWAVDWYDPGTVLIFKE